MKKRTTIHLRPNGTGTVEIDGVDISNSVLGLSVEVDPNNRQPTTVRLTLTDVELKAEAEDVTAVLRDLRLDAAHEEAGRD